MNQEQHWDYTLNEWKNRPFADLLDEAFTQKVDIVYDIGACVGGWSKTVTSKYPVKQVYAFEPFQDNFEALISHQIEKVTPLNFGIWYGKKRARAIWRGSNVGAIFIDDVDTTQNVDTYKFFDLKTLEEVDAPKPDLIKFDVEGAEKNIFQNSTILKTVPQLIVEWHFVGVEDARAFFKKYVPNHKIVKSIEEGMFLLRL